MARTTLTVNSPNQFRAAMNAAGLDGQQLATTASVSKQFISLLIRGRRRCRPAIADSIAKELCVNTDTLFTSGDVSEKSNNSEPSGQLNPIALDDPILTFEETAALLKIADKTLRSLRAKGEGPRFHKRGQLLRIRKSAAERWYRETYEDVPAE